MLLKSFMRLLFTALGILILFPQFVTAEEQDWTYSLTPYVWLPTLNTDVKIDTRPAVDT